MRRCKTIADVICSPHLLMLPAFGEYLAEAQDGSRLAAFVDDLAAAISELSYGLH
jgi:hypothetical protein